jgi:V8-like Glu-specific endopeptidase
MIFDGDLRIAADAARRWRGRTATRTRRAGKPVVAVETAERIEARLKRLTHAAAAAPRPAETAPLPEAQVLRAIGLERTIGQSDFQGIAFLELGLAVSRFVGRVSIRSSPGRGVGFGTGFMVSPRLLLTNNHVLPSPGAAEFSEVEFDYQNDRTGRPLPLVPFALEPQTFFMTGVDLDFTLVAVAEGSRQDTPAPLARYGWSRLIAEEGKILIGEHVNIIQHPKGRYKQFVSRANELVDILENHLHYVTDTEQGSSGSPVYNDQWEVVALHHSGVPRMENGQYMAKGGGVWDGRNGDDIDWIANEGVRVSRIVRRIEAETLDRDSARLRDELLNAEPPNPLEAAQAAADLAVPRSKPVSVSFQSESRPGAVSFTLPVRITVELGAPEAPIPPAAAVITPVPAAAEPTGAVRLSEAVAAIAALDAQTPAAVTLTEAAEDFGEFQGLPPQVELLDDGRLVKLLKPLTYVSEGGERWPVDAGSIVDGASIPRAFWSLIGGPFEGKYRNASIVHDRYCDLRSRSWEATHRMFHDAMRCSGVPFLKAKTMFYAVHRFGPRWSLVQEATGAAFTFERRAPTDADAAGLLEDVRRIYAENPSIEAIEAMADARG